MGDATTKQVLADCGCVGGWQGAAPPLPLETFVELRRLLPSCESLPFHTLSITFEKPRTVGALKKFPCPCGKQVPSVPGLQAAP